jgi:phage shock protein A
LVIAVIVYGGKTVRKFLTKTKEEVKVALTPDPIKQVQNQLKDGKQALVDFRVLIKKQESDLRKLEKDKKEALEVAKIARDRGLMSKGSEAKLHKANSLEAFELSKHLEQDIKVLKQDIEANIKSADVVEVNLSKLQRKLNKAEMEQKRSEARSSANAVRKKFAKDACLKEGVFAMPELDSFCEEEAEAEVWEGMDKGSVIDEYKDEIDCSEEFEKFYGKTK